MRKWTYALIFSLDFMSEDEAKNFLNARDEVIEWLHVFEQFYLIVSSDTASGDAILQYAKRNQLKKDPNGLFLLSELAPDRQGYLPSAAWNIIERQSATAKEDPAKMKTVSTVSPGLPSAD